MRYEDLDLAYDRVNIYPINNSSVLVASLNEDYMADLQRHFSIKHPQARFLPAVKAGNWDGVIRMMKRNGALPRGLMGECQSVIKEWGIRCVLEGFDGPLDLSNFDAVIENELLEKQEERMEPWEHQIETAKELLKVRRGITRSATSAGKSYTIAMIVRYLLKTYRVKKVLIVVPRTDLVVQFFRDNVEYGIPEEEIGMYFGDIKDTDKPIICATWQSLQNVKEREFFEQFECLIIDECFAGDTLVNTENGYKMIKDLKCGELVYSYNEETNETELKPITKIYENRTKSKKLIKITLENGKEIKCTPNHLIKTENRGWVEAKDLKEDDNLHDTAL